MAARGEVQERDNEASSQRGALRRLYEFSAVRAIAGGCDEVEGSTVVGDEGSTLRQRPGAAAGRRQGCAHVPRPIPPGHHA